MHAVSHADDLNNARWDGIQRDIAGDLRLQSCGIYHHDLDDVGPLLHMGGIGAQAKCTGLAVYRDCALVVTVNRSSQGDAGQLVV